MRCAAAVISVAFRPVASITFFFIENQAVITNWLSPVQTAHDCVQACPEGDGDCYGPCLASVFPGSILDLVGPNSNNAVNGITRQQQQQEMQKEDTKPALKVLQMLPSVRTSADTLQQPPPPLSSQDQQQEQQQKPAASTTTANVIALSNLPVRLSALVADLRERGQRDPVVLERLAALPDHIQSLVAEGRGSSQRAATAARDASQYIGQVRDKLATPYPVTLDDLVKVHNQVVDLIIALQQEQQPSRQQQQHPSVPIKSSVDDPSVPLASPASLPGSTAAVTSISPSLALFPTITFAPSHSPSIPALLSSNAAASKPTASSIDEDCDVEDEDVPSILLSPSIPADAFASSSIPTPPPSVNSIDSEQDAEGWGDYVDQENGDEYNDDDEENCIDDNDDDYQEGESGKQQDAASGDAGDNSTTTTTYAVSKLGTAALPSLSSSASTIAGNVPLESVPLSEEQHQQQSNRPTITGELEKI